MKTSITLIFLIILFSCKKEYNTPDPTRSITEKWWCAKPGTGTIASQFFNKNGTWEQGSKGGKFNDSGKWNLSADNKKIVISSVLDYNKKSKNGWEYSIETATESNLLMKWTSFGVKMDLEVCK